jgi:hypothetical protein
MTSLYHVLKRGASLENEEINDTLKTKLLTRLVKEFKRAVEIKKRERLRLLEEERIQQDM